MIMPSDKDYQLTKQIMLGKATMEPDFHLLADFIDKAFGVKTINIVYDTIEKGTIPRLNICFESEKEKQSFERKDGGFDKNKQKKIADQFREIVQSQETGRQKGLFGFLTKALPQKYQTGKLWVIYSAFEPIARIEADERISYDQVMKLKQDLGCHDLWEISRAFNAVTFFLYTNDQLKRYENSETKKHWAHKYFDLLEPYNEFGYLKRDQFNIYLDSKENFDNNYASNWYYYYK